MDRDLIGGFLRVLSAFESECHSKKSALQKAVRTTETESYVRPQQNSNETRAALYSKIIGELRNMMSTVWHGRSTPRTHNIWRERF